MDTNFFRDFFEMARERPDEHDALISLGLELAGVNTGKLFDAGFQGEAARIGRCQDLIKKTLLGKKP